jgi:hypothetical protein
MMRPVGRLCWLYSVAFDVARGGRVCTVLTGQNMRWFELLMHGNRIQEKPIQLCLHQGDIDRLCQRFDKHRIHLTIH